MYKCGHKIFKLKKKAVDKFKEWNMYPFNKNIQLDERIIRVLVYSCVKEPDFKNAEDEYADAMLTERIFSLRILCSYSFFEFSSDFFI